MIRLIPNEIVKATGGRFVSGIGLTMIDGIHVDDRQVTPGSLFVPLKNSRHASVEKAFQKGAVAVLVNPDSRISSRTVQNNPKKIFIEVEDAIAALAKIARFWRFKLGIPTIAVVGNKQHLPVRNLCLNIFNASEEIASAPDDIVTPLELALFMTKLHAGFRKMVFCVNTEKPNETEKMVYTGNPSVLVVTDTTKNELKELIAVIKALEKDVSLLLNADDPSFETLKKAATCRVTSFGTKKADICAEKIKKQKDGSSEFDLNFFKDKSAAKTKEASVPVCLAAAASAHAAGLNVEEIKKRLEG